MPARQRPRKGGKAPQPKRPEPGSYDEWQGALPPREKRVEDIVSKMMQGAWLSGVSDKALAQEWNLDPTTVRQMAAEASRMVRFRMRLDPKAQEEARAQLLQLFDVIRAKAMAKGDPASLRVALDALRAYGFYLGIEPAKQLTVTQPDIFAGWTTEEKLAFSRDGSRPRRAANGVAVAVMNGAGLNGHGSGSGNGSGHDPEDTN